MNINKWTAGLAAMGVVSLPARSAADEKVIFSPIDTAVSSTILSGYVDTSAHWVPGTGNFTPPAFAFNTPAKQDGFNLNSVKLALEKPLLEEDWSTGYKAEMLFGPNAALLGTLPISGNAGTSQIALKQAYVDVRVPVGNGLDFKVGVFDAILGYESTDGVNNPNYTRSYGYTIEPTTHTGILATYSLNDMLGVSVGVANSYGPAVGGSGVNSPAPSGTPSTDRAFYLKGESYKTYMAALAFRAPESFGFLEGSTLYAGVINGFNGQAATGDTVLLPSGSAAPVRGADQTSWYVGATVTTPVTGLKVGASYDYVNLSNQPLLANGSSGYRSAAALYASFQATEKMSVHARAEYFTQADVYALYTLPFGTSKISAGLPTKVFAATATLQYDLFKNVLSRLEFRWDHSADGRYAYGGAPIGNIGGASPIANSDRRNAFLLAANIVYKF